VTGPAFLTGGSGFVGGALLRGLVENGREVRALARSTESEAAVRADGGAPVRGDLFDEDALADGMRGCGTVFHVAGINAMCLRDPEAMFRTNVDGSACAVRAASRADVGRVVFTSSAATIGEPRGVVGTEDTPHRGTFLSAYERSKFLAERSVFELGAELGLDVVCVNPSSVQGPGRTEGSARLLLGLVNARLPVIVETFLSIVDVDDCTRGHLAAEARGRPGERYILNGASLTTRRATTLVQAVAGRPRHVLRVPRAVAPAVGAAAGWAARMTRRDLPLCSELARTLLHGHRYDGSRATRELGLAYRPIEETVARTLAWYADRGLIPALGGVP
jgi:dihydroflavonol-4-reductase